MIIAWFMRYGSLELQVFDDLDELAETLVMLDDAESCVFDQWGCFDRAEDAGTGHEFTAEEVAAAEQRVKQAIAESAKEYKPHVYTHRIYVKDKRGRKHLWRGALSEEDMRVQVGRLAGLGDRVVVVSV